MKRITVYTFFVFPWILAAQSGVTGSAPVTLANSSADCNGHCITVDVEVDITGLVGTSDPAGLNAFVLAFELNRSDVLASVRPGTNPISNWDFVSTSRDLVDATNKLTLVGAVADSAAPNQIYHVATIVLCGFEGEVTLSLLESESSLGSRYIAGDGPGPIVIGAPPPFLTSITVSFPLIWGTGIRSWLQFSSDYDLVLPNGNIDVLDLVKLVNCGQP